MSNFESILTVGFDKNGVADFRISGVVQSLDYDRMSQLREMIIVAIGTMETDWRRVREEQNLSKQFQGVV